jgi:hypothetical protein
MFPPKPNYLTAMLGGIITAIAGIITDYSNIDLLFLIITAPVFLFSIFYLVVGVDFLQERFKKGGIKAFIFPSSKEDLFALFRMIVWFLSAGILING